MKLLIVILMTLSANLFAQDDVESSKSKKLMEGFLSSIEEVSIENKIYQMKEDGISSAQLSVGIGLQGQIYENVSEGCGYTVIPFEIVLMADDRAYIKVSPVSFQTKDSKVSAEIKFLSFEYQRNYLYADYADFFLGLVEGKVRTDLYYDEYEGIRLEGEASLNIGAPIRRTIEDIKLPGNGGLGAKLEYGVTLKKQVKHSTINLGLGGGNSAIKYRSYYTSNALNAYNRDQEITEQRKQEAIENGEAGYNPVGYSWDSQYAQHVIAKSFYLQPSIGLTKKLKSGNSLGVDVSANLFFLDKINGVHYNTFDAGNHSAWVEKNDEFIQRDMLQNSSRNKLNFKLTYTFGNRK